MCLSKYLQRREERAVVGGRGEEFMRKRLEKDEILIGEWGPFPPKERDQRWREREREGRLFAF